MTELNNYYANYDEDTRLTKDNLHQIEYLTTISLLKKHLLQNSKILDCCAGTGIYSFELARDGHTVTAGDIVEKHAEIMKTHSDAHLLNEIYCGNVLDMSRFSDNEFDVVLCFGALYHLLSQEERDTAVKECLRILKPDGIFAFSYLPRQSLYIAQLMTAIKPTDSEIRIKEYENLDKVLPFGTRGIFYGMTPDEPDAIAEHFNLSKITQASTYPFFYNFYNQINSMLPDEFTEYLNCHIATCENESIVKHTMHGLYICKKITE